MHAQLEIDAESVEQLYRYEMARTHPRFFLAHLTPVNSKTGEVFKFNVLDEDEAADLGVEYLGDKWSWQRDYVDFIYANHETSTLKARQLGVTWLWGGLVVWDLVMFPGVDDLVYSIKEDEAVEVINRIWDMYLSLPAYFKEGLNVLKPFGDSRPTTRIEIEHPDGRVSTVTGMPATKKAGHSRVARRVLFDEAAHQEYAREIWKAIVPTIADGGGYVGAVSTANGMSDGQGGGNFFHEVYTGAGGVDYPSVKTRFLKWDAHPDRDAAWRESVPLDANAKAEQYPADEDEAFLMSGHPFFSMDALRHYGATRRVDPKYRAEFIVPPNTTTAKMRRGQEGLPIDVYREPRENHKYAIGADCSTGGGLDYSVAAVIDLDDGAPCAEIRMKADYRDFVRQLHYLGRWFNTALIAPEKGGGYGDVVVAYLRDGHEGRPPYPRVYRHRRYDDPSRKYADQLGFPMHEKTRAKVISELSEWFDGKLFPWVTRRFLVEARTFVRADTRPSPRAADGSNDDAIMAWGIALEMYSQYGEHRRDIRKTTHLKLRNRMTDPLDPRRKPRVANAS